MIFLFIVIMFSGLSSGDTVLGSCMQMGGWWEVQARSQEARIQILLPYHFSSSNQLLRLFMEPILTLALWLSEAGVVLRYVQVAVGLNGNGCGAALCFLYPCTSEPKVSHCVIALCLLVSFDADHRTPSLLSSF